MISTTRSSPVPTHFGKYQVQKLLGEGGMGSVYLAFDPELERPVAIKRLQKSVSKEARLRILREAQVMAKLSHPNLVTVYEIGTDDEGHTFIAMEYLQGQTLDVWAAEHRDDPQKILELCLAAGEGLWAAHKQGIVHRDFKPQNVLVLSPEISDLHASQFTGRTQIVPKVLDFGLARLESSAQEATPEMLKDFELHTSQLKNLTQTGAMIGTPAYMAPEQHFGQKVTPAADQFAFAVTLYECLTGVHPFNLASLAALRESIALQEIEPHSQIPGWVYKKLCKAMRFEAGDRYASIEAMLAALRDDPAVKRKRWFAAVFVVLLASFGFWGIRASMVGPQVDCGIQAKEAASLWSMAIRTQAESHLHDQGMTPAMWSLVDKELAEYSQELGAARENLCEAHHHTATLSAELFDLRIQCLSKHLSGLRTISNLSRKVEGESAQNLLNAVQALPKIEDCLDLEPSENGHLYPQETELAQKVEAAREKLAEVEVLIQLTELDKAEAKLEEHKTEFEAIDFDPLQAEVNLQRGDLAMWQYQIIAAKQALERTLQLCNVAEHKQVCTKATVKWLFVEGYMNDNHNLFASEALWMPRFLADAKGDAGTISLFHNVTETIYDKINYTRGSEHLDQALKIALESQNISEILSVQANHTRRLSEARDFESSLELALQYYPLTQTYFGQSSVLNKIWREYYSQGIVLFGYPIASAEIASLTDRNDPYSLNGMLSLQAIVEWQSGDKSAALATLHDCIKRIQSINGPHSFFIEFPLRTEIELLSHEREWSELITRANQYYDTEGGSGSGKLNVEYMAANAYLKLGQFEQARAEIARSVEYRNSISSEHFYRLIFKELSLRLKILEGVADSQTWKHYQVIMFELDSLLLPSDPFLAMVWWGYGELREQYGFYHEAYAAYDRALQVFERRRPEHFPQYKQKLRAKLGLSAQNAQPLAQSTQRQPIEKRQSKNGHFRAVQS